MSAHQSAAIDLGSNTIRLLVASPSGQGIKRALVRQQTTRLGQNLQTGRPLSSEAVSRTIKVLKDFRDEIIRLDARPGLIGATAAVREAVDGRELMNYLRREFGFETMILSGEQEADLTAAGVMTTFSPEPEQALIMDLGGRSAEFIIRRNARNEKTVSLPLGVVALTETFLISDPPGEDEMKTLSGEVADVLKDRLSPDFIEAGWNLMIGTAGTATTLAAVAQGLTGYNPELINGYVLKSADIECMFANFIRVSRAERARTPGLPEDRADIIIAGIGVIMETMKFININRLTVSDAGLLEGIWLVAAGLKECHHA